MVFELTMVQITSPNVGITAIAVFRSKNTIFGELSLARVGHFIDHITREKSQKIGFLNPEMTIAVILTSEQVILTF